QFDELLTAHFEPAYWDDVGGPGHLEVLRGGVFLVASRDVHERANQIIERLRTLPAQPDSLEPVPVFERPSSPKEVQLLRVLDRITSLNYQDVSLPVILDDIGRRHGVKIVVATKPLEEASFDLDAPR